MGASEGKLTFETRSVGAGEMVQECFDIVFIAKTRSGRRSEKGEQGRKRRKSGFVLVQPFSAEITAQ
jgi:hypothetical protein